MTVSAKVYGGEFDGLVLSFNPGPLPDAIRLLGGRSCELGDNGITVTPGKWYVYTLEYIDPETGSPLIERERLHDIVGVYVTEPLIRIEPANDQ
jgi:hypothetical protein